MAFSRITPSAPKSALAQIETEAREVLASQRGQLGQAVYSQDGRLTRMTNEKAFATAIENDPSLYEAYRREHNSRHIVETLKAAGVKL